MERYERANDAAVQRMRPLRSNELSVTSRERTTNDSELSVLETEPLKRERMTSDHTWDDDNDAVYSKLPHVSESLRVNCCIDHRHVASPRSVAQALAHDGNADATGTQRVGDPQERVMPKQHRRQVTCTP